MWKKYQQLGAGSYGTVYLAVACDSLLLSSPSVAAVKTAELENSGSLRREAQFLKEFRDNPYIIQGYGEDISMEENGGYFYNILMEYASGGTLAELIEGYEDIMPESHIACYTYMLLKGLSDLHREGFVHCDIKPGNVLVFPCQQGLSHLKLADFGLSKHALEDISKFRGTPYYAAPESLKWDLQGTAADIWSLGCVVLEMMNGRRRLWKEENRFQAEIPEYVSESGKDFLKNCFQDEDSRWSADMLLDHPFIQENIIWGIVPPPGFELRSHNKPCASQWITTEGMFSSSASTRAQQQCSTNYSYQLFPEIQGCNLFAY